MKKLATLIRLQIAYDGAPVKNSDNKILFSIKEKKESHTDTPGSFSILLRVIALIILFVFINNVAAEIVRKENFISGFVFLAVLFFLLRLVVYLFPFPFQLPAHLLYSAVQFIMVV